MFKRTQDVVLSATLLALCSIPMAAIAISIKCDSPGPVLFKQSRRGVRNTTFPCFKFRTMYASATDIHATTQTKRNDPRVTRVGAFLRRTSLDELPQLFNILIGHMSLVGPRPHALGTNIDGRLLPDLTDFYLLRYAVRPGVTGLAQINGTRGILDSEAKFQRRLDYDLRYIHNWTPTKDWVILIRTLGCVFDKQAF